MLGQIRTIHFRDVRRWSNAALFTEHQAKVRSVIEAIRPHQLLCPADLETLLDCPSCSHLRGFPRTVDTLDIEKLHELLGENWIGDSILDARAYQIMERVNSQADTHRALLILPPIFYLQLSNAYRQNRLSKQMKNIRESLLADLPRIIAFSCNKEDVHWAPCATMTNDCIVRQGDSLGWSSDKNLCAKLRWFLADVMETQGEWSEEALTVPRQGPNSGSCGIITLSVIHSLADPTVPIWSVVKALEFRMTWLKDFLERHLKAIREVSVCSLLTKNSADVTQPLQTESVDTPPGSQHNRTGSDRPA